MKDTRSLAGWKAMAIVAALMIGNGSASAYAGETTVYLKSGWFTWDETVNGSSFVKEKGFMHGAGITRRDPVGMIAIAERFEVWGGDLDYDGHDVTGAADLKSSTSYLGTREEVAFSAPIPAGDRLSFEPFLGLGHKFWIRTRSSEDWNSFYSKAGLAVEYAAGSSLLFLKGGAIIPFYNRTHVALSDAGYTDVVTEPKSRVSAFAEGGVKFGAYSVSVEFEGMEFGRSDQVPTHRIASAVAKGVIIIDSLAYQPRSTSKLVSLKLGYSF